MHNRIESKVRDRPSRWVSARDVRVPPPRAPTFHAMCTLFVELMWRLKHAARGGSPWAIASGLGIEAYGRMIYVMDPIQPSVRGPRGWLNSRLAAAALLAASACDDQQLVQPPGLPGLEPPSCPLDQQVYVVNHVQMTELSSNGTVYVDVDGDGLREGKITPAYLQLGQLGASLVPPDELLASGAVILLLQIERCADGSSDHARVHLDLGIDEDGDPSDNFSGEEQFVLAAQPAVPAVGTFAGDSFNARYGTARFPLAALFAGTLPGEEPETLPAFGVTANLTADSAGASGVLGLGFDPTAALVACAAPIAEALTPLRQADPGCPEDCNSFAGHIAGLCDLDDNLIIEPFEAAGCRPVQYAFSPEDEADLLAEHDGELVFWPLHDAIEDHVALGMQFQAVPALVAPAGP